MKIEAAFFERAAGTSAQLIPSDLPEIAFSGRSNVGKSSLINKLLQRKALARTSSTPGKTATVNFYHIGSLRFVDLPGYGYAKRSHSERLRWAELMEGYFNSERDIRMVMQLIDLRHAPTEDDLHMVSYLLEREIPFCLVFTKSDKLNKAQRKAQEEAMETDFADLKEKEIPMFFFSSVTGESLSSILELIQSQENEEMEQEQLGR